MIVSHLRHLRFGHAFALDAQHHYGVRTSQAFFQRGAAARPVEFAGGWQELCWTAQAQFADAERGEGVVGRACHSRMAQVTDDGHRLARKAAAMFADGEGVQQPLGRVRQVRFTGRQDADMVFNVASNVFVNARFCIANDEQVHTYGLQRVDGVQHGLALHARGQLDFKIDDIGAQAFAGQFERRTGTRRRFGEEIPDRDASKRGAAGGQAAAGAQEIFGPVQQLRQQRSGEPFQREQMAQVPVGVELGEMHPEVLSRHGPAIVPAARRLLPGRCLHAEPVVGVHRWRGVGGGGPRLLSR